MHIGSSSTALVGLGVDGMHVQLFLPARSCFIWPPGWSGKSITAAPAPNAAGAALRALRIFAALAAAALRPAAPVAAGLLCAATCVAIAAMAITTMTRAPAG